MEKFTLSAYHKIIWQHTIWLLSNRRKFWENCCENSNFWDLWHKARLEWSGVFSVCLSKQRRSYSWTKKPPKAAFNVNTVSRWTTGGVIHILLSGLWCAPLSCGQQELVFRVAQIICVNRYTLLNASSWIILFTKFVKENFFFFYMYVYLNFKL